MINMEKTILEMQRNLDDKHYVMAMLVRGGVFGVSSKEKD